MAEVGVGELFVRLLFSLGVVIGLMAGAAWLLKRVSNGRITGMRPGAKPIPMQVLGRQQLGRRSSVAMVRAGDRGFIVGVTDQQVTLLAETTADELMETAPPRTVDDETTGLDLTTGGPTWKAFTEQLRERTVRRS